MARIRSLTQKYSDNPGVHATRVRMGAGICKYTVYAPVRTCSSYYPLAALVSWGAQLVCTAAGRPENLAHWLRCRACGRTDRPDGRK